jgi:ubiquinone biosynthesis protein
VGEIDEELRDQLVDFLLAFTVRDPDALAAALVELSVTRGAVDRDTFRDRLSSFVAQYSGMPLSEIHFTHLITTLLQLLREQHLQLPQKVSLVLKVLIMIEGIGIQLDPEFDLNTVLTPYARRMVRERLSLSTIAKRLERASIDTAALLLELPVQLRRGLRAVDRGGFEVHLRAAELDPLVGRLERIGNRLVAGMITAALINGVGQLVGRDKRWRSWDTGFMGAGLTIITTLGGYLAWTAQRRRKE